MTKMENDGMAMLKRWASYIVELYKDNNEVAAKRWWLYLRGAVEMYFTLVGEYEFMTPEDILYNLVNEACEEYVVSFENVCDFIAD